MLTYLLVGNCGVPAADTPGSEGGRLQTFRIQIAGLVILRSAAMHPHFIAARSLLDWCASPGVPILHGADTSTLTRRLPEHCMMQGGLYPATRDRDKAVAFARRRLVFSIRPPGVLTAPATLRRGDPCTVAAVWCKHPVETGQMYSRLRHQCRQPGDKIQGAFLEALHHFRPVVLEVVGTSTPRFVAAASIRLWADDLAAHASVLPSEIDVS